MLKVMGWCERDSCNYFWYVRQMGKNCIESQPQYLARRVNVLEFNKKRNMIYMKT